MSIRLNGSTSGYTEIDAPAVAGSNTLVLPTGNGTANQALVTDGSGALSFADRGRIVQGTAQNSTSGTSIDFTGIPSWVKRVTVMFNGVSTNGVSSFLIQIGDSGGVETTGYNSTGIAVTTGGSAGGLASSAGFVIGNANAAARTYGGIFTLCCLDSGITWSGNGSLATDAAGSDRMLFGAGVKALSPGPLDRIRITTVNGTDTFDAGSINILYEG